MARMHWDDTEREGITSVAAPTFRHHAWPTLAPQRRRLTGYGVLSCINSAMVRPTGLLGAPAG